MEQQELLHKIWEEVHETKTDIAVIKNQQENYLLSQEKLEKEHLELKKKHYSLKNEFKSHKNFFAGAGAVISTVFGLGMSALYNWLTK